jgi:hypothetical protein
VVELFDSIGITSTTTRWRDSAAERLWLEYDKLRWRFASLTKWIEWKNDEVHGALWALETPREAFQRKLPPESLLGLHMRAVEQLAEAVA